MTAGGDANNSSKCCSSNDLVKQVLPHPEGPTMNMLLGDLNFNPSLHLCERSSDWVGSVVKVGMEGYSQLKGTVDLDWPLNSRSNFSRDALSYPNAWMFYCSSGKGVALFDQKFIKVTRLPFRVTAILMKNVRFSVFYLLLSHHFPYPITLFTRV